MTLNAVLFDYGDTLISTRMDWARIVPESLAGPEQALAPALPGVNYEEACYSVIEGVPGALRELSGMGLKLAVVSNATCPKLVRRALERFDLLGLFDRVVVSAEVGICKPAQAIFVAALQWLGEDSSRAAVVGDLLDKDIAGAERSGMRSVLVDFFGEGKQAQAGGPKPDALIRRPEELVGICRSWME